MLALALAGLASVDLRTLQKLESELNALIPAASHASELAPLDLELPDLEQEDAADGSLLERRRFDEHEIENAVKECNEPFAENACAAGYSALMRWYSEKKCVASYGTSGHSAADICPEAVPTCSADNKCTSATPPTKESLVNIQHQCKSRTMASWPDYPKNERMTRYINNIVNHGLADDERSDVLSWVCNLSPGQQDHGFVEPLDSWDPKGAFSNSGKWDIKDVELEKPHDTNSALRERRCVKVMQIGMYRYLIAATVRDDGTAAPKDTAANEGTYNGFWDSKGVKEASPGSPGGRGAAYPVAIRLAAPTDDDKPEHTTNYVDGVLRVCPPAAPARSPLSAGLVRHSGCG